MFTTITIIKCMNILYWISSSSFRIRHNNKGGFAPWYLESVTIEDTETEIKSVLPGNCWLDKKRTSLETILYLKGIFQSILHRYYVSASKTIRNNDVFGIKPKSDNV